VIWTVAAIAAPLVVRVPVPTTTLYDVADRVCLTVPTAQSIDPTEVDDGRFELTCSADGSRAEVCLKLLLAEWPERVAPLDCGPVRLVPVPAFDPGESIGDGVRILRRVSLVQASFRAPMPDAPGLLPGGRCGVTNGQLWVVAPPQPKHQACTLVTAEGERVVPVTLVDRL
jgi:hypothetical protein